MNANGGTRKAVAGPLGDKRTTRAASKAVVEASGVSKAPFADHGNAKPEDRKVLRTKLEAKELAKKTEKENAEDRAKKAAAAARSASRFDEIVGNCADYSADMDNYILWLEKKFSVNEGFLADREVTPKMRSILMDWLVEVHIRFHLLPETFYGTVSIVDRYLACGSVDKGNLQLVGVSSMCISAKYEEIYAPELQDYEFISDNSFSRKDLIRMEMKILSALRCELGRPSVILFVRRLSVYFNSTVHTMAKYISEIAVCDYTTCHLLPSSIAAVAVWISAFLNSTPFPASVYGIARMSSAEVHKMVPVFARVIVKHQMNKKLTALRTKYGNAKSGRISDMSASLIERLEEFANGDAEYFRSLP